MFSLIAMMYQPCTQLSVANLWWLGTEAPGQKTRLISGITILLMDAADEYVHQKVATNLASRRQVFPLQWSLYFKTTHGTKKMWSYIAGGLKIKVI